MNFLNQKYKRSEEVFMTKKAQKIYLDQKLRRLKKSLLEL